MLATFFGGLALMLASIGLYGVMAYGVARVKARVSTQEHALHALRGAAQELRAAPSMRGERALRRMERQLH